MVAIGNSGPRAVWDWDLKKPNYILEFKIIPILDSVGPGGCLYVIEYFFNPNR